MTANSDTMQIVGYADRLSAAPGDVVRFMVSSRADAFHADIVRLRHGNADPSGPGPREAVFQASIEGEYSGAWHDFPSGSYIRIPDVPAGLCSEAFSIQAWVFPTLPGARRQGVVSQVADRCESLMSFELDEAGALALRVGDVAVSTGRPLRPFTWYFVAAVRDAGGQVRVEQRPATRWPRDEHESVVIGALPAPRSDGDAELAIGRALDGKIESPRMWTRALTEPELHELREGRPAPPDGLAAAWDFSLHISSRRVDDVSGNGLHGEAINLPMRAVTGRRWDGSTLDFKRSPERYGAIFFHHDDMTDARWPPSFELEIPDGMPSGVYAARLQSSLGLDRVPFFVRPRRGIAGSPLALLLPTFSYLAYSNDHMNWKHPFLPPEVATRVTPQDTYADEHALHSAYDKHADGTGVCVVSRLRPLVNMRPDHRMALHGYPHQFPADLHIVDWLEEKQFSYDVITDEDLHEEQLELLSRYRVLMTGSHPEYWSEPMLAALEGFRDTGGRIMYMGANGSYWVTSVDPEQPHVIEIRRGLRGTSPWRAAPGEAFHATTGEEGGLWRDRGHPPQSVFGVGMTAQGFDAALPYHRRPDSHDPRVAFIFEGVAAEEPIGDFGLVLGGAAGFELDRADFTLGTPPHALVLATATGFSDSYQHVIEEVVMSDSLQGGSVNQLVRADLVFYETVAGGAVFSVGSVTWTASLSHDGYENSVSRITENVLGRFLDAAPFESS